MIAEIENILVEEGYEILESNNGILRVKDLDCGIVITCILEEDIFFMSVFCKTIKEADINITITKALLNSENGISTSFFNLHDKKDGTHMVTLNNFCKLQELGADDRDDILSCLSFLSIDLLAARDLLEKHT